MYQLRKQDLLLSSVRVDCTQADMLITFLFGAPFEGRVYSTGNPQACFEMGNGQAQIVLRIPMGTQCGTVQQVNKLHEHFGINTYITNEYTY